MRVNKILLTLAFLITIVNAQFSTTPKVGTTVFQFLKVIPNAEAAGLGGISSTTITTSDAVFYNPAVLVNGENMQLSLSYLDYFLDVNLKSASLSINLGNWGVLGAFLLFNDVGEMDLTTAEAVIFNYETGEFNPGLTGEKFSVNSQCFGMSYAKRITNQFSFGLNVKYVVEDLYKAKASAFVFDGGVLYEPDFKYFKLGVMIRNFGKDVKFVDESYPLPQELTIGVSSYLIGGERPLIKESNNLKVLLLYNINQTRDHSQQQHLGAESSIGKKLFIRIGRKFYFDEEDFTYGVGINLRKFRFDYAYNKFGEYLPSVNHISFSMKIK
ncbi:MAG: hypothetical protein DRP92_03710 [Candidatus Neomarinimicrobiota bacterium]|nr:MAG: hypothetical protein DRP92_03710 [Candidatus Neomarinimicrobiota bacterium]